MKRVLEDLVALARHPIHVAQAQAARIHKEWALQALPLVYSFTFRSR